MNRKTLTILIELALVICASESRATVGESSLFSFDTRQVDGLADNVSSAFFVLDTRAAIASALVVNGTAVISPGGTAFFTASLPLAGGGVQDVTSAVDWTLAGSFPPGTVIGPGVLKVGTGSVGGSFEVRASYQSPAGRILGQKTVITTGSIHVNITHSVQSLGGNNYAVQLNGESIGGVGPVSFQWNTASSGTFNHSQSANPILSLASTGGKLEVVLTVTDSTSALASAKRTIFIDKPTVPNQPGKLAPASDGSQGVFLSITGSPFQFDPAKTPNGLIVLTHGLESSGKEQWIQNLAQWIHAEIPVAQRPNILIYDWEADSNPNGVSLPSGSGAAVFVAKKFAWVGKLAGTALSALTSSELVTDLAGIKPMGMAHGTILGNLLIREAEAVPSRIDFTKPVHFIGHSAGGFVLGEAAWVLKNKGFIVDRVTMLDTPFVASHHLSDLPNPGVVDRYASSFIGLLEGPGTWRVEDTDYHSLVGAFPEGVWPLLKGLTGPFAHDDAHEWYRATVYPDEGYEQMGFHFSPFKNGPVAERPSPAPFASLSMTSLDEEAFETASEAPVSEFQVFGNSTHTNGIWTLSENSDAGIFAALSLPPDAVKLQFKYRWSGTSDGDFLGVRFGARPELFLAPDLEVSRGNFLPAEVEIGSIAGLSDDLIFTLVSRGGTGAVLEIKDIIIVQDEDADGDGLTTAQELAVGTHCQNPDSDGDSIDDRTELHSVPQTNPLLADSDGDGTEDAFEVEAGTDPTSSQSYFRVSDAVKNTGGAMLLRWPSQTGRYYNVQRSTDVTFATYEVISQGQSATPPMNTFSDNSAGAAPNGRYFYRIEVYQP